VSEHNWLKAAIIEAYDNMAWGEMLDEIARRVLDID
jgi:hypothetical protein